MLSMFGLRVHAGCVPVHASTHIINTSQWHHSVVNSCYFVRKQYEPSVKSLRILNKRENYAEYLRIYLSEGTNCCFEGRRKDSF